MKGMNLDQVLNQIDIQFGRNVKKIDKETRDKNFYKYQNRVILSLINQIEDNTQEMFHISHVKLNKISESILEKQSEYKKRSKLITKLESTLQDINNQEG